MQNAKPYEISKHLVMDAFQRVKSNGGSAGIDGVTIAFYEEHLKDNRKSALIFLALLLDLVAQK